MIFDSDEDLGRILSVDIDPCDAEIESHLDDNFTLSCGDECKPVHPLPRSVITADQLSHLNSAQQQELCDLLDSFIFL